MLTINLCPHINYQWEKLNRYIPIGLLSLAAVAENDGHQVEIKDINYTFKYYRALDDIAKVADYLVDNKPDLLGFSTICNCYPTILRLAGLCKKKLPGLFIVLGGPQASVTALQTMRHFDAIDGILTGEGEIAFPSLLETLGNGKNWDSVYNLVWRSTSGIVENKKAPLIKNLDELPMPAYHLNPFSITENKRIPIESGRGCPYHCVYCSTSRYWGGRFRMKSVKRLLSEIRHLTDKYKIKRVEFVQDNMTSSPKFFRQFCHSLKESGLGIEWGCSARIDVVNTQLAGEMADSGCIEIFYGIESGSEKVQGSIQKQMDYSVVLPNAESTGKHGIRFTASFITGFPEENLSDLKQTLQLIFRLRYASGKRNFTHLHLLSPLPGTPIQKRYKELLYFDGQPSDIALSLPNGEEKALIAQYPDIFSAFYTIPVPALSKIFLQKVYLVINFSSEFPYTMFVLWKQEKDRLIELILEELDNLPIADINFYAEGYLETLKHIYDFLKISLLPKIDERELLADMMFYELCTKLVDKEGRLIESFSFDIEQILADIDREMVTFPIKCQPHPTAYLFVYENQKVQTIKLAEGLAQLLA